MSEPILLNNPRDVVHAAEVYSQLRRTRPVTKRDLRNYVKAFLGIDIPHKRICPEHSAPMDYLWHSFAADIPARRATRDGHLAPTSSRGSPPHAPRLTHVEQDKMQATMTEYQDTNHEHRVANNADCIVWANRGGGKTELAAVATLLDCVFKCNCQVRILGGSGEQAGRMYEYLTRYYQQWIRRVPRRVCAQGQMPIYNGFSRRGAHAIRHQCSRPAHSEAPLR